MIGNTIHNTGGDIASAIRRDIARARDCNVDMKCCQIFAIGPTHAKPVISDKEIADLQKLSETIKIIIHSSYLSNPWGAKAAFGVSLVKKEMEICKTIGGEGVVVHLAKRTPEEISAEIPKLISKEDGPILYLEIESYKPSDRTYERIDKIIRLFDILAREHPALMHRIGLCVDTAHLWAAGVDISTRHLAKQWLDRLHAIEEIPHIMFHLNDQVNALESGRDKHASLTYGTIWGAYSPHDINSPLPPSKSGLNAFLDYITDNDSYCILERHEDRPKINDLPEGDNITADYITLHTMGYFHI